MVARVMLENGYRYGRGLGRRAYSRRCEQQLGSCGPPDAKLPNWEIVELPVIFNFK
ncbi:hypothetical protein SESBI_29606 [Sesbania bispinosa]|nr:hypothetical protein SESBI_29606 [Sesbania bispinosa]